MMVGVQIENAFLYPFTATDVGGKKEEEKGEEEDFAYAGLGCLHGIFIAIYRPVRQGIDWRVPSFSASLVNKAMQKRRILTKWSKSQGCTTKV